MKKCIIKCTWEANKEQRRAEEKKAMEEASESINQMMKKITIKFMTEIQRHWILEI